MRRLIIKVFGLATILASLSCEPTATFDSPQPYGLKNESSFNKNFRGDYYSIDSSAKLIITETSIVIEYPELDSLATEIKTIDSTNNTTFKKSEENTQKQIIKVDTIFQIADGFVLKKYRGHYFLNTKSNENQKWQVNKLSLDKNLLTIASIIGEEDIKKLNEITKTAHDTTSTSVNYDLNKKQFKEFLNANGFGIIDSFTRINH